MSRTKSKATTVPPKAETIPTREKNETLPNIGFFDEKKPGNRSMARLLSFLISVVPLSVWALANLIKFIILAQGAKASEVTLVPIPESVVILVTGGLTLKWAQKRFGEGMDKAAERKEDDSQERK